jgi:hypothetical protein
MAATLGNKLQLKDGQGLDVLDPPPDLDLSELSDGEPVGVLAFVKSSADAARHAAALAAAADGLAWGAYPKKSSGVETDITRDHGWDAVYESGLQPVRQIAIDDTWSALRFRPR